MAYEAQSRSCHLAETGDLGSPLQFSENLDTEVWVLLDLLEYGALKAVEVGRLGSGGEKVEFMCIDSHSTRVGPHFQDLEVRLQSEMIRERTNLPVK